ITAGEQETEGAVHVHVVAAARVVDGTRHRAERRLVEDAGGPRQRLLERGRVPQAAEHQRDGRDAREGLPPSRGEVLAHADTITGGEERGDEVRADEAGATGHDVEVGLRHGERFYASAPGVASSATRTGITATVRNRRQFPAPAHPDARPPPRSPPASPRAG